MVRGSPVSGQERYPAKKGADHVEPSLQIRPDRATFDARAEWPLVPVWTELLADVSTPVGVFPRSPGTDPGSLLESVERSERWGRYSFVAGDPAATVLVDANGVRIEDVVRELPIASGLGGDGCSSRADRDRALAPRSRARPTFRRSPADSWGTSPTRRPRCSTDTRRPSRRRRLSAYRADGDRSRCGIRHWRQRLILVAHVSAGRYEEGVAAAQRPGHTGVGRRASIPRSGRRPTTRRPTGASPTWTTRRYRQIVSAVKEHILAGDIFQGVPSRRVSFPAPDGGFPIYRRLRVTNPAPYMFFVRMRGMELAGSSPEPLVRVEGRAVHRPIAGTRPRGQTEMRDRLLEHELLADPKERAEHAMLVDLARNDIGRVCVGGCVPERADDHRALQPRDAHRVERGGRAARGQPYARRAAVTFPAGTVRGAPKSRAMQLIAELEPTARGPYAVAVGYFSFDGDLDSCITIRTAVVADGRATVQTGAGVVADSDPQRELDETKAKAAALLPAVAPGNGSASAGQEMRRRLDDPGRRSLRQVHLQPGALIESLGRPTEVVKTDAETAEALAARGPTP